LTVFGDGSQTRSFCYVDDLISGILSLMEVDFHDPVNIGNPEEMQIVDLAKLLLDITGSKSRIDFLPLPVDDPKVRRPDITRAKELFGWEPRMTLRGGLLKTIDYFKNRLKLD